MKHISIRVVTLALLLTSYSAHSAPITSINNLNIVGTLYNVTFHVTSSFNDLFDLDDDELYGEGDGALFNRAPIFFGDNDGALSAAEAIVARLGLSDFTNVLGTDMFIVPSESDPPQLFVGVADNLFHPSFDNTVFISASDSVVDIIQPIATFELVTQNVSMPPTIILAGLALAIMGVMKHRVC